MLRFFQLQSGIGQKNAACTFSVSQHNFRELLIVKACAQICSSTPDGRSRQLHGQSAKHILLCNDSRSRILPVALFHH